MPNSETYKPEPSQPSPLDDFFAECDERLTAARHALLELEPLAGSTDTDANKLEELFRAFHSIKGLSAMVALRPAEELAHQMESYLGALRQGRAKLDAKGFGILVEGVSHLQQIVEAFRTNAELPETGPIVHSLQSILASMGESHMAAKPFAMAAAPRPSDRLTPQHEEHLAAALLAGQAAWWVTFRPSPALAERHVNVNTVRSELMASGELLFSAPSVLAGGQIAFTFLLLTTLAGTPLAGRETDGLSVAAYVPTSLHEHEPIAGAARETARPTVGASALSHSNVVRVGLSRLDELMRMVGDLVLTRSRYEQHLKQMVAHIPAAEWRVLQENNGAFERQIRDLREGIMRVRLVPIGDTFGRMQFIIRDLTREFDKEVRVQILGGETEVDKFIVERVMDPLLHLVRNAVSHGIESAAERIAAGKPPMGLIVLRARTEGQTIIIEVEDDGHGIDRQQVFARAQRMGLVLETDQLEDAEILDILCAPGFSTRDEVDRTSGRGVGMDVVKSTVEELGGRLTLFTEIGRGTRFSLQLPLTLSIADALIFDVGDQTFALPQASAQEVFEFDAEMVSVLENNEFVIHRGNALPLLRLAALFGLSDQTCPRYYAIIVGEGRNAIGLVVHRLLGLNEIVVRPLNDPLVRVMGIAGVTELGDGRIVLILDAQNLIRGAAAASRGRSQGEIRSAVGATMTASPLGVCHGKR